ncbi:MAG: hypothetical protein ACO2PM_23205 [Pyrobaculum sp.]
MSEVFYRRVFLLININAVLYAVVGIALMLLVAFGVFSFMAGWSLPLVFLFFFLFWALVYEAYGASALFLLKRFFEGFRCRLRPPAVCILYKPKKPPEVPVLGGFVFPGLFFTAAFIIDEKSWQHELQHVRDAPLGAVIRYVRHALFFTWFVAMIVLKTVLTWLAPLLSATVLTAILPYAMESRAYRREGVPLPAALEYIDAGRTSFIGGLTRNHTFYLVLILWAGYQAVIYGQPHPDLTPNYAAMAVAGGSALVFALVLRWALGVFTRRLFGIDVGDFLFSSFIAGAVLHPLLGVFTSFLFSWAMFGKAKDAAAAAALAALSLFAVMLPGLVWMLMLLL